MFSRKNAIRPPPTNIVRMRITIGRRVSPNVSRPFSTGDLVPQTRRFARDLRDPGAKPSAEPGSACRDRQGVAQEQGAFGGDQLSGLQTIENLVVAVPL